jgi:hypothetical protein
MRPFRGAAAPPSLRPLPSDALTLTKRAAHFSKNFWPARERAEAGAYGAAGVCTCRGRFWERYLFHFWQQSRFF